MMQVMTLTTEITMLMMRVTPAKTVRMTKDNLLRHRLTTNVTSAPPVLPVVVAE